MGLLAQLFRHKSASHSGALSAADPGAPEAAGEVRGVGAIAAAAGVTTAHGMPAEFAVPLGEIIARVPEHCVWPGRHDAGRMLRIPAADIAPGLERGKPQLSLARLAALAPGVFRWERGASEAPQVRLPIQRLLQQIRSDGAADPVISEPVPVHPAPDAPAPSSQMHASPAHASAPEIPVQPVKLPPPGAPEVMPSVSVIATERPDRPLELRPSKDVAISTTLRAVVLGGVATGGPANAQAPAGQILAPRVVPAAPAQQSPVVPGPSVVHSANEAAVPPALRATPDLEGLQNLFMTEATPDLRGVAALVVALPGIRACVISGAAGDAVAGDFPQGASVEEVLAASGDLARIGGAAMETLHRGESDIAVFLHDEVCVAAVVKPGGFVPGVRERLAYVAELLAGSPATR